MAVDSRKWSILLVEDDRQVAQFIKRAFESVRTPAFGVTEAGGLKPALDLLRDRRFDPVLLDLNLPDARNLTALEEMIKAAPELPVVILTGAADEGLPAKAVELGAEDFIQKGHVDFRAIFRTALFAIQRRRRGGTGRREDLKIAVDALSAALSLQDKGVLTAEDALAAARNAALRLKQLLDEA